MSKLMITTNGNIERGKEHRTIIKNAKGEEKEFYTDGYDGISFKDITEILDFIGIEYFSVHKN